MELTMNMGYIYNGKKSQVQAKHTTQLSLMQEYILVHKSYMS